jgi:hypothetical protein
MGVVLTVVVMAAGVACGDVIPLDNADIETNASALFGDIDDWGPNGGWADHAGFAKPNNDTLGLYFGFYSVNNDETVGQLTAEIIQPNKIYTFSSWAQGGGNDVGEIPYQIGYADTTGDLASFVELATSSYSVGNAWEELAGVSYATGAAGDEIGKELIVRLGPGDVADPAEDVWFDSFSAEVVPEPATVGLLALGAAALFRRRR